MNVEQPGDGFGGRALCLWMSEKPGAQFETEVTVRLDGADANITATLDSRPLYAWTGPSATLSQHPTWATTEPGSLALGTYAGGWVVSEVKVNPLMLTLMFVDAFAKVAFAVSVASC